MEKIIYRDNGGLYGSRRSKMVEGIDDYSYSQVMNELKQGKKFISYPFFISLGFLWFSDISAIYLVERKRQKIVIWFISLLVTIIPHLFFIFADYIIIRYIGFETIDIGFIIISLACFLGTVMPLRTVIILIKDGGIDLTPHITYLLDKEYEKSVNWINE